MMPPGYQIRLATVQDYASISEVSKRVYADEDMIPSYFNIWTKNKDVRTYLVEYEKKCVAFQVVEVMETDRVFVFIETCIDPDHRAKKIFIFLTFFVMKTLRDEFLHISAVLFVSEFRDFVQAQLQQGCWFSPRHAWTAVEFAVKSGTIEPHLNVETDTFNHTKVLNTTRAIQILQDENLTGKFFPRKVCSIHDNWFPMFTTEANMRTIALQNNVVITIAADDVVEALSYGDTRVLRKKSLYTLYYCGDPRQSFFVSHIETHLKIFQRRRNPKFGGNMMVNLVNFEDDAQEILRNMTSHCDMKHIKSYKISILLTDVNRYVDAYQEKCKL